MSPIPVVVCGKNPNIAKVVRQHLAPQYDVIHILLSPDSGVQEIPLLLTGQTSTLTAPNIGSQNYASPPAAIVTGGGFDDEAFNRMRDACRGTDVKNVPWLRPDLSRLGEGPGLDDVEGFGKWTAERVKKALNELGVSVVVDKEEWKEKFYYF